MFCLIVFYFLFYKPNYTALVKFIQKATACIRGAFLYTRSMTNPAKELLLSPRPAVIACLTTPEHLERLPEIKEAGADLAEFRADQFIPALDEVELCCCLEHIRSFMPVIFTLRSIDEGGSSSKTSEERQLIAKSLLRHMDALDIETEDAFANRMAEEAAESNVLTIASQHFTDGMPPDDIFEQALRAGKRTEADIVKLACTLKNRGDLNRLGKYMLMTSRQKCMLMGMGVEFGAPSRMIALASGTPGVYVTPETDTAKASVPGQLSIELARRVIDATYPLDASS